MKLDNLDAKESSLLTVEYNAFSKLSVIIFGRDLVA